MKLVGLTLLLATCFVCGSITAIMAVGGILTGRIGYLHGRPPIVFKEHRVLFLLLCSLYIVLTLVYAAGVLASSLVLYMML